MWTFPIFLGLFSQFYYCTVWLGTQETSQAEMENPLASQ